MHETVQGGMLWNPSFLCSSIDNIQSIPETHQESNYWSKDRVSNINKVVEKLNDGQGL